MRRRTSPRSCGPSSTRHFPRRAPLSTRDGRDGAGWGVPCYTSLTELVAEQYHLMPAHAARKTLVDSGRIGRPTSVQVSSTHLYHAVSLIRRFVGAGFAPARVHAEEFVAPLANPLGQGGWSGDDRPVPLTTTVATVDFGGTMGLYDFTDNQWHNQLRSRRQVSCAVGSFPNRAMGEC